MPRQAKIIPTTLDGGLVQLQRVKKVFSMAFPRGAACPELHLGLLRRKGSDIRSFERNLRHGRYPLPRVDSFRRPEEFAILRISRIFLPLVVENRESQRLEPLFRRFSQKA